MKKLSKYLITNVIKILILTEFTGVILFTTVEFFEHMDIFTKSAHAFFYSALYLILRLPYYVNLLLPLAFLIAILVFLIIMVRGNEIVTLRTSGISTLSIMKPIAIFSLVLVLFSFALAEWISPFATTASDYIYKVRIKGEEKQVFYKNNRIWFKRNNVICNIDLFDGKKDIIKGITVLELNDRFGIHKRYDAPEGVYRDGAWQFVNVTERTFDGTGIVSKKTYERYNNLIQEPPSVFKVVDKTPEEMSYKELSRYIRRLQANGHDVKRYLVDLYNKIAFPFINLIMVFAAFSVGLRYAKTKHISKGIISGILVGACYWGVHSISLALGYSDTFPPIFAAWFSNFLFIACGVIGIITLRT